MDNAKRAVIFAAGPIDDYTYLRSQLRENDWMLCADGGIRHCLALGIVPDLIVGDFDSYTAPIPFEAKIEQLPIEKDDTDTGYCVKRAIAAGFDDILIFGGLGGRLDHSFANIQTLAFALNRGCRCRLLEKKNRVYLMRDTVISFPKEEVQDMTFSVFSYSPQSYEVTLRGLKYSLQDATLTSDFPLGVSNEWDKYSASVSVSVQSGTLLLILSQD